MKKRVYVLGGGFGGLYAALELERRLGKDPGVEITLVNRENFFLFTPMLHEVAASDLELTTIVNPARKLLRKVQLFAGEVEHIDVSNNQFILSHGFNRHSHTIKYDHLVLALGSVANFHNLPGLAERRNHDEKPRRCRDTSKSSHRPPGGGRYRLRQRGA